MPLEYELQANQKAFEVNMDPRIYGAFAEIGAAGSGAQVFHGRRCCQHGG